MQRIHNIKRTILSVAMGLLCLSTMHAYDFCVDGIYYSINSTGVSGVSVTYGESSKGCYIGDVVIPEKVSYGGGTYAVTAIGRSAFNECPYLTSVTIPASVTLIDNSAFYACYGLKDVNISDIDKWMQITNYSNPLTYALRLNLNGKVVEDVVVKSNVYSNSFKNYTRLKSVTILPDVTELGFQAFQGCTSLKEITIPKSVTNIGQYCFNECTGLERITFEDGNEGLYLQTTFRDCKNLKRVYIGRNISLYSYNHGGYGGSYADNTFAYRIGKVVLGDSLTKLDSAMFSGDADTIEVSPGLKKLSAYFGYTRRNASVNILDWDAWFNIDWESSSSNPLCAADQPILYRGVAQKEVIVPQSITQIKQYAIPNIEAMKVIEKITFKGNVQDIGYYGIPKDYVKTIDIGESTIDVRQHFNSKHHVIVSANNPLYSNIGNSLYTKDGKTLLVAYDQTGIFIVPDGVTTIANNAFIYNHCNAVVLPSSLQTIENGALSSLSNLPIFNFSSLTITSTMAPYVTTIYNNYIVKDNYVYAKNPSGQMDLLGYVGDAKTLTLPRYYNGNTCYLRGYFFTANPVETLTAPQGYTSLPDNCFAKSQLDEVVLPSAMTTIGNEAFPQGMLSVNLPSSVTSVGRYLYYVRQIICEGNTPPTATYDTFYSSYSYSSNPTVYVKSSATEYNYQNADYWKNCPIKTLPSMATITVKVGSEPQTFTRYKGYTVGQLTEPASSETSTFVGWEYYFYSYNSYIPKNKEVTKDSKVILYDMVISPKWQSKYTPTVYVTQEPTSEDPTAVQRTTSSYTPQYQWYYKWGTAIEGATESTLNPALVNGESDVYCTNPDNTRNYRTNTITVTPPSAAHWPETSPASKKACLDFTFNGKTPQPVGRWQLASFDGDECKGVAKFTPVREGNGYWSLMAGNLASGTDSLTMKLYDSATGKEYVADRKMPVKSWGITGSADEPYSLIFADLYKLIYKVDGEDYAEVSTGVGYKVTAIENAVKKGYKFSGWQGVPTTMPERDVTITGTFSPYTELTLEMPEGWTWVSVNGKSDTPVSAFGDELTAIKDQNGITVRDPRLGLIGEISTLSATNTYKVRMSADSEVRIARDAKPYNTAQELHRGWNWIGAIVPHEADINEALHSTSATEGDIISSQDAFATYSGKRWVGTLESIDPGKGYLMLCSNATTVTFDPTATDVSERNTQEPELSVPRRAPMLPRIERTYPDVLNIIGELYIDGLEDTEGGYTVVAMHGNECRGIGQVAEGRIFLTIHGNANDEIRLVAVSADRTYECAESLTVDGDVKGTMGAPYQIWMSHTTGSGITLGDGADESVTYDIIGRPASTDAPGIYIKNNQKRLINK